MKNLCILFLLVSISTVAVGQVDPVNAAGVAIGGYDPVAYFTSGTPVAGDKKFQYKLGDITYYFSSQENKDLFVASPLKYTPQFEGYCALAVSYGKKISIDPKTFKVIDGKLYLFYNGKTRSSSLNSLETWNKNEASLLQKANRLWPDVRKVKYDPKGSY